MRPAAMTYADCLASCRHNVEVAVDRARGASTEEYRTQMLAEATHWRGYAEWYEKQIRANPKLANEPVKLGAFGKAPSSAQERRSTRPEGQTSQAPQTPPQPHWSEPREPGSDDDSPIPF